MLPRLAALAAMAVLAACGAPVQQTDLTPSGGFDPVKDRPRVLHCLQAHLGLAHIGIEVLGLDEATVMAEDRKVFERMERLKPFARVIDIAERKDEGALFGEAGRTSNVYDNQYARRALIPGQKDKLWAEAKAESEKCDALAVAWGPPPL